MAPSHYVDYTFPFLITNAELSLANGLIWSWNASKLHILSPLPECHWSFALWCCYHCALGSDGLMCGSGFKVEHVPNFNRYIVNTLDSGQHLCFNIDKRTLTARFMGPTWVLLAPDGPMLPHEPCYLGSPVLISSSYVWYCIFEDNNNMHRKYNRFWIPYLILMGELLGFFLMGVLEKMIILLWELTVFAFLALCYIWSWLCTQLDWPHFVLCTISV